jgi:hypothetical protein
MLTSAHRHLLVLLLALSAPAAALATGPSQITIHLRPVAVNAKGEVLMKTWRASNPEGLQRLGPVDLGWLVVSADGLWKEATYRVDASVEEAKAWFEGRLDWGSPPPTLRPLLAGRAFSSSSEVKPDEGAGKVAWTSEQSCVGNRCTPSPVVQRTLGGLPSSGSAGQPACLFYRAGIAILRNATDGDSATRGARFNHPGSAVYEDKISGPQETGFFMAEVDAVALLPERLLGWKPAK